MLVLPLRELNAVLKTASTFSDRARQRWRIFAVRRNEAGAITSHTGGANVPKVVLGAAVPGPD